jgi:hypothetical protein
LNEFPLNFHNIYRIEEEEEEEEKKKKKIGGIGLHIDLQTLAFYAL